MNMMSIAICLAALMAVVVIPRLLVLMLVTLMAAHLFARSRHVTQRLLADRSIREDLNYDRKPSWTERRLMRQGLHLALEQTELRSLFPSTVSSVERWTTTMR